MADAPARGAGNTHLDTSRRELRIPPTYRSVTRGLGSVSNDGREEILIDESAMDRDSLSVQTTYSLLHVVRVRAPT